MNPNQQQLDELLRQFNDLKATYQSNPKNLRSLAAKPPKEGEDSHIPELRIKRAEIQALGDQINKLLNAKRSTS